MTIICCPHILKCRSNFLPVCCSVDVTNREKVLETANKVLSDVGDVTILVNNAGIMPQHEMLKHTEKEIRMVFEINTIAHCWMFQAFLPRMIEKNRGHIVALSSIAGIVGFKNLVPYCGSKFAVRGMMEALFEELRLYSNGTSKVKMYCKFFRISIVSFSLNNYR